MCYIEVHSLIYCYFLLLHVARLCLCVYECVRVSASVCVCSNVLCNDCIVLYLLFANKHALSVASIDWQIYKRQAMHQNRHCYCMFWRPVITRHSLVRAKGEVLVLLYVFCSFFVNDFSTTRGPIHAKFCMRAFSGSISRLYVHIF